MANIARCSNVPTAAAAAATAASTGAATAAPAASAVAAYTHGIFFAAVGSLSSAAHVAPKPDVGGQALRIGHRRATAGRSDLPC